MKKLNFILFLVCAGLTVANWNAGNQGVAIWMGFLAIGNLLLATR